jgi:hypothetical protein
MKKKVGDNNKNKTKGQSGEAVKADDQKLKVM